MPETVSSRCKVDRGRKIHRDAILALVGANAGRCAKPGCETGFLWKEFQSDDGMIERVRLAEIAHIVAASPDGPRGSAAVDPAILASTQNLVLLCPNCHTTVDAAPGAHSTAKLLGWKASHELQVASGSDAIRYESRPDAHAALSALLDENYAIWLEFGPESPANAHVEMAAVWLDHVAGVVLPNNERALAIIARNGHLLVGPERQVVAQFKLHVRALEARHLFGSVNPAAPRFPTAVTQLFATPIPTELSEGAPEHA